MITPSKIKVFLVDDDALFLKTLKIDFLHGGEYEIYTFATGELCIEKLELKPDVIILDYWLDSINMGAINGIQALDKIKAMSPTIPIIVLSAQDKIEVAVNCMKHKAFDYIVKSETAFMRLDKAIKSIMEMNRMQKALNWYMAKL